MIIEIIRFFFILVGAIAGAYGSNYIKMTGPATSRLFVLIISIIIGSGIGYVAGGVIGRRLARTLNWIENNIQMIPLAELIASIVGVMTGLVLALLVSLPAFFIPDTFRLVKLVYIVVVFAIFGWVGLRVGTNRWEDLDQIINARKHGTGAGISGKLLDTNVIIDGRISDIAESGFIEGELTLPRYVLKELQYIADSEDAMKRSRGRRGLDVLHKLQNMPNIQIRISENDYTDVYEVDAKLVKQAKESGAAIVTNDYNLNKVASLEGVKILNINDLANAVKPVLIAGEEMAVKVMREGKEAGQGVGYLDDGTMVVIEGGSGQVGNMVSLTVTSVLQTPAGRMIFAKMSNGHRS